ncbi:prepilin-type N-terminal cleavage/methylation domain-containing protein [Acidobacteria bacterium AH-259-D05]|nr:prepilin-type N-terminal cleavage/methylation domain-containing protein [Acidobacteria bacterium AH-259-D05]
MISKQERGFSLIELLIVVAVIGVIVAIAIPNFVKSKLSGNEASAISTVRNVVTAEMTYMTTKGSGQYATMTELANNLLVDEVVGTGTKAGYSFTVSVGASKDTFTVNAKPLNYNLSGIRSFYSDQSAVIRYTTVDAQATSADDPL